VADTVDATPNSITAYEHAAILFMADPRLGPAGRETGNYAPSSPNVYDCNLNFALRDGYPS
jgi:hypothetical protein